MPTIMPTSRRRTAPKRSRLRIVFDFLFNTALVVSALILTFIVLVREEQFGSAAALQPGPGVELIQPQPANGNSEPPSAASAD